MQAYPEASQFGLDIYRQNARQFSGAANRFAEGLLDPDLKSGVAGTEGTANVAPQAHDMWLSDFVLTQLLGNYSISRVIAYNLGRVAHEPAAI